MRLNSETYLYLFVDQNTDMIIKKNHSSSESFDDV
jgi:hypothetical protein